MHVTECHFIPFKGGRNGQVTWERGQAARLAPRPPTRPQLLLGPAEMADCPLHAGRTRPGRTRSSGFPPRAVQPLARSPRPPPADPGLCQLTLHRTCLPQPRPHLQRLGKGDTGHRQPLCTLGTVLAFGRAPHLPARTGDASAWPEAWGLPASPRGAVPTLGDGGPAHIGTHGLRRLAFKRKRNPTNAARVREVQVKTERLSGVPMNGRLRGHLGPSARRPALRAWSGTGLRVPVSTPSGAEIVTLP